MLFRQTNIIWVAFVAVQSIGPYFIHTIHCAQIEQTDQQQPAKFSLTTTGQTWEVYFIYFICKYMVMYTKYSPFNRNGRVMIEKCHDMNFSGYRRNISNLYCRTPARTLSFV